MNYKNRGMFLESIINKTIKLLEKEEIAMFSKQKLNINFASVKKVNNKLITNNAYIATKSTIDYLGIYEGVFIAFEAKSTEKDYLLFSNIKDHQHEYLNKIIKYGGIAFYIVCFKEWNEFYVVETKHIKKQLNKKIKREYCKKYCYALNLEYPGIINIITYIDTKV